jgi:hypothetical protein
MRSYFFGVIGVERVWQTKFAANDNPGAGSAGHAAFGGAVVRPGLLIFLEILRRQLLLP